MATAEGVDIGDALLELELPAAMKNAFADHYAKQPELKILADGSCSRCGAKVHLRHERRHAYWHRNTSFQIWMMGKFVQEHSGEHLAMTQAIGAVIEAITAVSDVGDDGEGIPSTHPTFEEADMPRLHVHEEGTAHDH